ncbi:hypothetical protein D4764_11G0002690 [Takifugu flavidus]|uniref:Uncharacterized protein n=1 Tax=Takifugu flavidus TaxID=433684 RepID=A0A5C6PHI9_9TELE|nr:hypothetical protein D4764_11G0002690 [Takifugu flavidus]
MVHLESKFMSKLDEYTSGLMKLFHSKGGTMGLKLQAILLKAPTNPSISMTRDVVIRCLMVYLGESTDQLLKEMLMKTLLQDLAMQKMKICSIRTDTSDDVGIGIEGIKVLTALGTFPRACSMFVGLNYAVNLAYPNELRGEAGFNLRKRRKCGRNSIGHKATVAVPGQLGVLDANGVSFTLIQEGFFSSELAGGRA